MIWAIVLRLIKDGHISRHQVVPEYFLEYIMSGVRGVSCTMLHSLIVIVI